MAKHDPTDKLLDELLAGKKPAEILGKDGVLDDLRKRLFERASSQDLQVSTKVGEVQNS